MRVQSENDYRILASFSRRVKIFYHVTIYFRCQMSPRSQFPFLSYLPISGFSLTSQHRYHQLLNVMARCSAVLVVVIFLDDLYSVYPCF